MQLIPISAYCPNILYIIKVHLSIWDLGRGNIQELDRQADFAIRSLNSYALSDGMQTLEQISQELDYLSRSRLYLYEIEDINRIIEWISGSVDLEKHGYEVVSLGRRKSLVKANSKQA